MKLPAHEHLDRLGIPYESREFPTDTEKGAANVAAALGYREDQMVKTLVFEDLTSGEHVLVMVAANRNAISGRLKKAIGSKNIRMAQLDSVQTVTGYAVGSVPPFHWQPDGFRSFVDEALMHEPLLGVGAGQWGQEIMITPDNLVAASGAQVFMLSERPERQ